MRIEEDRWWQRRQAQPLGKDEKPAPAQLRVNCWCQCMRCTAIETEIESL